ncbi:MAG: hypothetical protein RL011_735, partial [Pseudomonadota bacterium]
FVEEFRTLLSSLFLSTLRFTFFQCLAGSAKWLSAEEGESTPLETFVNAALQVFAFFFGPLLRI